MRPGRTTLAITSLVCGLLLSGRAQAQGSWSATLYVQQSFPKQTASNTQIEQINAAFGTDFDTWDDVANLNVGATILRHLTPRWELGVGLDYSRGSIDGQAMVDSAAGPATLRFEQEYSVYADVIALAHVRFCDPCSRWIPFAVAGIGVAYEKDSTSLTLQNEFIDATLAQVENDGWFPVATLGFGLDADLFGREDWYLQGGLSYFWGHLKHTVPAEGDLLPSEVTADTDSTGPNIWLGLGFRF